MPLLLSPEQIAQGQYSIRPIVTPSGTQGIFLQNVSSLSITVNSRLGSVQIPPAFIATLPMDENDQITFEAIPSGINFPSAFPQYVDVSYSFVPVAPAGTGLFIVPTTGGAIPAVSVAVSPSSTIYDGQVSITTTPAAIGSQAVREVILTSDPTNPSGSYVYVGNASGQHTPLAPGESITLPIANLNLVYAHASSGTLLLDYLGRN